MNLTKVYYIRHNFDNKWDDFVDDLFENKKIGIHFNETTKGYEFDENSYKKSGKTAIKGINYCNENNVLIVAAYNKKHQILIGESEQNSKDYYKYKGKYTVKTLKLKNCKTVSLKDFYIPFLIAPPFSTMVNWKMGEKAVNRFFYKSPNQYQIDDLLPWQFEILAAEWLRENGKLKNNLLKVGKYMKAFDIVGINDFEKPVIAQVKYKCSKADIDTFFKLASSISGSEAYFFTSNFENNGNIVSLKRVFDFYNKKRPDYIKKMIHGIF